MTGPDPQDIAVAGLTALQLTQVARARQTELESLADPTLRFAPVADELAAIDPRLVTLIALRTGVDENGEPITVPVAVVDTANVAGLAWAAAAVAGDRVAALEARVEALEAQIAALS